jgi:hypothetical protein
MGAFMNINMGIGDWIGVVSLILSIPLGIAANLLAPRFLAYLENRKLLKTHRSREQALLYYNFLADLKSGRRDRYPYYILLGTQSVLCGIASATCILIFSMVKFEDRLNQGPITIAAIGIIFLIIALVITSHIASVARRLENFEAFKERIRKTWGDDAV